MDSNHQNHHDEEALLNALLLPSAHVLPFVLNTAIELDLFNIMAKSGSGAYVSASEIASQLPTKNPDASFLLDRMLHLFVTHSLLSYASKTLENERVEKTYSLTSTANFFIGKVEDGNIAFVSRLAFHSASIETWLASQIAANCDNIMLTQLSGKERTAKEFEALAMAAGFCNFRVACVPNGHWAIMESYK